MRAITMPALPKIHTPRYQRETELNQLIQGVDAITPLIILLASLVSIIAWWYFFRQNDILLYRDAHSHLTIARRVVDNTTPGLAQLGGVWLPLPHVVMVPFVWINVLWNNGLAGSIPSMIAFVVTTVFLYKSVHALTNDAASGFISALVFMLNPNILYLQATPLSELVLLATMTVTCYYFLMWGKSQELRHLVRAGGATFLATLARYDGWALFLACLGLIVLVGLRNRVPFRVIRTNLLIYGFFGALGIALWFLWNEIIFADPLFFQHSQYSAQNQQRFFIVNNYDHMYHSAWYSIHDYAVLSAETVGPALLILAIAGWLYYLARRRVNGEAITALAFLAPIPFYIVSFYGGQAIMFAPGAVPATVSDPWFNDRYGVEIVIPVAIFLAVLSMRWPFGKLLLSVIVVAQSFLIARGGIVTLQDGQQGFSCYPYSVIAAFLQQHYDSGYILNDTYNTQVDYTGIPNLNLRDVIYQGSGKLWLQALHDPQDTVNWVVVASGDLVAKTINTEDPTFRSNFVPLVRDYTSGAVLFHRQGLPTLPTRSELSGTPSQSYQLCGTIPLFKTPPIDPNARVGAPQWWRAVAFRHTAFPA